MKRITIVILFPVLSLCRQEKGSDLSHDLVASLLEARNQQRQGDHKLAIALLQKALTKTPASPALLNALGSVQQDLGDYNAAEQSYLRALAASPAAGKYDVLTERLSILSNLGTLYVESNQYQPARPVRAQLEEVFAHGIEQYPVDAAAAMSDVLASLEYLDGRDDQAAILYQQAIKLLRKAYGPVSAGAANVKNNLGYLQTKSGQHQQAKDLFQQSIEEVEITLGPRAGQLVRPLINLAHCENLTGSIDQANKHAERAVAISLVVYGARHQLTATAMMEQALALRRLNHKKEARRLEKVAGPWLTSVSGGGPIPYTVDLRNLKSKVAR